MKRLSFVFLILFIADFIIDSLIANSGNAATRYLTKGFLMPLLLGFFIAGVKGNIKTGNIKYIRLICLALIFSFIGDVFLVSDSTINFISGIGAFLVAQVFYILSFYSIYPFLKTNALFLLIAASVIAGYVATLNYLFWPIVHQQNFVIPVLAYSIVLGLMLFTSVNMYNSTRLRKTAITYFIPGAIIFVASDSMIAFNRFYLTKQLPGFYIMFTYCLAQFLIVNGARKTVQQ